MRFGAFFAYRADGVGQRSPPQMGSELRQEEVGGLAG